MRTDEGIQLHLFDMDKYGDTIDEDRIIFVAKTKSHIEFTSLPFHGNPDAKYCITEVELPEGKTMMEINQQIQMLMGQPEELAKFINLQASGE